MKNCNDLTLKMPTSSLLRAAGEIGEKQVKEKQDDRRKLYLNLENSFCINLTAFRVIFEINRPVLKELCVIYVLR